MAGQLIASARGLVRKMTAEERETVSFKTMKALLLAASFRGEDIAAEKEHIKAALVDELTALRDEGAADGDDELDSKTPATAKLSGHRAMRRREDSPDAGEESDESDAPSKKRAKSVKPAKTKEPRVWSESVEKLKALVVKLSKGLPSHIPSKLPTTIYRGSPSDEALQEKIKQYLQTKGWSFDESSIDFPDPEKVAAFQRKVVVDFELNGIDTENIVEAGGARPRRAAAVAFLDKQTEGRNSVRAAADDDSDDEVSLLAAPTASEAPRSSKAVPAVAHGRYNLADSSDSD